MLWDLFIVKCRVDLEKMVRRRLNIGVWNFGSGYDLKISQLTNFFKYKDNVKLEKHRTKHFWTLNHLKMSLLHQTISMEISICVTWTY